MAGVENLKPVTSKEEARARGRNGGIKSGESRRARKTMRAELEELLAMMAKDKNGRDTDKTVQSAITAALIKKALAGDTKAYEIIRDTIGEKPADKITLAAIDQDTIDAVEKMVSGNEP